MIEDTKSEITIVGKTVTWNEGRCHCTIDDLDETIALLQAIRNAKNSLFPDDEDYKFDTPCISIHNYSKGYLIVDNKNGNIISIPERIDFIIK